MGPLEVHVSGERVQLGGTKQRAVLAMLVLRVNHVISTDALIDGVWGSALPHQATNVVQAYVSRLKKIFAAVAGLGLDDVRVCRRGAGYLLELDPLLVDLYRFEHQVATGLQLVASAPNEAAAILGQALELWRGPPLAEFREHPLSVSQVARLDESRLNAIDARMQADLVLGRHSSLIGELEALIDSHPTHERLHERLMLSLYRSGRQADALSVYRRAREVLAETLGIDPYRALQDLESAILAHDPALDWDANRTVSATPVQPAMVPPTFDTAHGPRSPRPRRRVSNVPARNPHFIGRDEILDELRSRLRSGESTIVVQALYGLGGIGKTQLAIEYAHRFETDYEIVWWIDAEQPVLIPDQFVRLGSRLGLSLNRGSPDTVRQVLLELEERKEWLLIFDNAEHPTGIIGYRPAGAGHVLVTSRYPGWGELGGRVEVDVLARSETIALLKARMPSIDPDLAEELAGELGDLPLAAAQAAAYLEQTGLPPEDYLRRFRSRRADLMSRGELLAYHGRVDTAWDISLARLRIDSPSAVALMEIAAFIAAEPIPLSLFSNHSELLDEPLRAAARDPDNLADVIGAIIGYSLARRQRDGFQLHRLVQAVIRSRLTATDRRIVTSQVLRLLAASHPGDPNNPDNWADYARVAPHVLAASPLGDNHSGYRTLMLSTLEFLNITGDTRSSRLITSDLLRRWRVALGHNHPDTLTVAANLTHALVWLGEAEQALRLGQDTLERTQQTFGTDHPDTLAAASIVTIALAWVGESDQACELGVHTLDRASKLLGDEHPVTLGAAANLTSALSMGGRMEQAATLGQETLERARRALGPDHVVMSIVASTLSYVLVWTGQIEQARVIAEDSFAHARKSLGPDHPTTLRMATGLSFVLVWTAEKAHARTLSRDTVGRAAATLGSSNRITVVAEIARDFAQIWNGTNQDVQAAVDYDVLSRSRAVLGDDHPYTLFAASVTGFGLVVLGDHPGGCALLRATLATCHRVLGVEHSSSVFCATMLARALFRSGLTDAARLLGQDVLWFFNSRLGQDHPLTRMLHEIVDRT